MAWENLPSTRTPVNATNLDNITDSGSNANGYYIKFQDGTLICRKTISPSFAVDTVYGALFESGQISLGSTPYTFVGDYQISVTQSAGAGLIIEGVTNKSASSFGNMYVLSAKTRDSRQYSFDIIATGRWKA